MYSARGAVTGAVIEPVSQPLLDVRNLTVEFDVGRHRPPLRAVDDVTFRIAARETVGLVGESGSGKTTIGRAILGLSPIQSGNVYFAGSDITQAGFRRRRELSADLQVVFQDPFSSLNPTRTIGQTLGETLKVHEKLSRSQITSRVHSMLKHVGLPKDAERRYPMHFSGGQRQRIAIARALMLQPKLVICDEPVSALDLSVQAQVLNLLRKLQDEFHLSYLFIAHDLPVVRHLSHRIIVLYHGRVMEEGDAETVYTKPSHPYTQALLDAAPTGNPEVRRQRQTQRAVALRDRAETGRDACPFAPRCPFVTSVCWTVRPPLEPTSEGSFIACHHWREIRAASLADTPRSAARSSALP